MLRDKFALFRFSRDYWILVAFIALLGLTVGSGRDDLPTLVVVRPLAILLCFYGLLGLTREKWENHRRNLWFLGAAFALVLAYLVPLPPSLWQDSSTHRLIADIDRVAGLGDIWRAYSVAPRRTLNAFFSLFVPAAALLLMIRIDREERWYLLLPVILFGAASVMMALLQSAAPSAKALWFYRLTNDNIPVGLFANRNHAAVFHAALLPMLAAMVQLPTQSVIWARLRVAFALLLGLAAVVAVFASGSRAGLLTLPVAVISVAFLWPRAAAPSRRAKPSRLARFPVLRSRGALIAAAIVVAVAIGAISLKDNQPEGAAQRLAVASETDMRLGIWQQSVVIAKDNLPFGTGPGTFADVYRVYEPIETLGPNYINHAHNDALEMLVTMGIPGALLLLVAVVALLYSGWRLWFEQGTGSWQRNQARMAWVVLVVFGIASVVDYPLRVPSLSAVAIIFLCWITMSRQSKRGPST